MYFNQCKNATLKVSETGNYIKCKLTGERCAHQTYCKKRRSMILTPNSENCVHKNQAPVKPEIKKQEPIIPKFEESKFDKKKWAKKEEPKTEVINLDKVSPDTEFSEKEIVIEEKEMKENDN